MKVCVWDFKATSCLKVTTVATPNAKPNRKAIGVFIRSIEQRQRLRVIENRADAGFGEAGFLRGKAERFVGKGKVRGWRL
jgi:hypothetical protein